MKRPYVSVGIILFLVGMAVQPGIALDIKRSLSAERGAWLYVGGSGAGNYTKIQDALDNASDGDTVFVYDESSPYVEYLTIRHSITLLGESRDTTVINGIPGWRSMVRIIAQHVVVQGFSFMDHGSDGIYIQSDNVTINGNFIGHIGDAAIYVEDATRMNISENIITDSGAGVFFCNSEYHYQNNIIVLNIIRNITDNGIYISGNNNIIHGNEITQTHATGIYLHEVSFNDISSNVVSSLTDGIRLVNSYKNTLYRNTLTRNQRFGLLLTDASGDSIFENNFMENAQNARIIIDLMVSLFVHHMIGYPLLPTPTYWMRNFWDAPRSTPYPIPEHLMFGVLIAGWLEFFYRLQQEQSFVEDFVNFVRFDRNPAQESYDTTSLRFG